MSSINGQLVTRTLALKDCYMRFQDIFDGRTKHTDAWIDERQNTLLLTTPSKRKPSGRATQGVVTETE